MHFSHYYNDVIRWVRSKNICYNVGNIFLFTCFQKRERRGVKGNELLWGEADKHSQFGRDLSSTLWQLVDIEVKSYTTLQAEEAAAAALLED